jgi:hypothetical protein
MAKTSKSLNFILWGFIILGCLLRFIWPQDMEWKFDEIWMFEKALESRTSGIWPKVGMTSGAGLINPGLSVWIFCIIAQFTQSPVGMVLWVMSGSVLSILGFLWFVNTCVPQKNRQLWYWALALLAVNPMAILFARKIWAQDALPIFTLLFLCSHYYRQKPWAAFLWGFVGALLGQIHMSGFFFAFGFAALTAASHWYKKESWPWKYWILGSIIASMGMIPWILELMNTHSPGTTSIANIAKLEYFLFGFLDTTGLNLKYSLGSDYGHFLQYPLIGQYPTFLVALVHLILAVVALKIIWIAIGHLIYLGNGIKRNGLKSHGSEVLKRVLTTNDLATFYIWASFIGLGVVLTLSGLSIKSHYLIVAYPMLFLLVAKWLINEKKWLMIMILTLLVLSSLFLFYIHQNKGVPNGDYGPTYEVQTK